MERTRAALRTVRRFLVVWLPLVLIFFAIGLVVDVTHTQRTYAKHFTALRQYAKTDAVSQYSARPTRAGGWQIFGLDPHGRVGLRVIGKSGRLRWDTVVDPHGDVSSAPSMAWRTDRSLGAWVSQNHSSRLPLMAAVVRGQKAHRLRLTSSGYAADPFVLRDPHGGFDVIFTWQRGNGRFDVYGAKVTASGKVRISPKLLARSPAYGFFPVGAWDGQGRLDVAYFEDCCRYNAMLLELTQYNQHLRRLAPARIVDRIRLLGVGSSLSQWAMDMATDRTGRVWMAWNGKGGFDVARLGPSGHVQFVRPVSTSQLDLSAPQVSLALNGSGGRLFYTTPATLGSYVVATSFDDRGLPVSSQRVSYTGDAVDPRADVVGGSPHVIWLDTRSLSPVYVMGTVERRHISPTLLERLGLNGGSVVADLFLLAVGSLVGGGLLTVVNALVILPLLLVWIPISRFVPERLAWPAHAALVAAALALVIAVHSFANGLTFLIGPLASPSGWLAVVGGVFVGAWVSRVGLRDQEAISRGVALAICSFYFVAAMWTLGAIETHLTFA